MRKSISHERVVRYCIREHVCKSPDALFLESSVNSPTLVLYSLLARSLGIGMKPCNNVWRLGKRVQEGERQLWDIPTVFLPKAGMLSGQEEAWVPEQAYARMWGGDTRPGGGVVVPPATSRFAETSLSKDVMRFLVCDQSPVCPEYFRDWLWLLEFCGPASHVCQREKGKTGSAGRGHGHVSNPPQACCQLPPGQTSLSTESNSLSDTNMERIKEDGPPTPPLHPKLQSWIWIFLQG